MAPCLVSLAKALPTLNAGGTHSPSAWSWTRQERIHPQRNNAISLSDLFGPHENTYFWALLCQSEHT